MIKSNLTLQESANQIWDVIIVGAGPAGGLASILLSRKNLKVLLVDRQTFPRPKVCGCCLNGNAIATLKDLNLLHILTNNNAIPLEQICLGSGKINHSFALLKQLVISRECLDSSLIKESQNTGASFLDDTNAELGELHENFREVILKKDNISIVAKTKIVVAADGLGSRLVVRKNISSHLTSCNTRIGAGTTIDSPPEFYTTGKLFMGCSKGGYIGIVKLEDGRLDLAAAFDPASIKKHGTVGKFAKFLLLDMGWPVPINLEFAPWRGTPSLTGNTEKIATDRLFVIGDSAGYIEPFTGEGMAWAFSGAKFVAPLVAKAVESWQPELITDWQNNHAEHIKNRQFICKAAAILLRRPLIVKFVIIILKIFPSLSLPFIRMLDKPSTATLSS